MSTRRLLRMMAGEVLSPSERAAARQVRRDKRLVAQVKTYLALGEKIERRQKRDPSLPPMPFDFEEIEKRRNQK